jgi:hemerythrin
MKVEWQEYLSTGVAEIDYQHKQLINKYNAFFAACSDGSKEDEVVRLFYFLGTYVLTHFSDEEAFMQRIAYPDYRKHREQHLLLTAKVAELKERLGKEGPTPEFVCSAGLLMTGWVIEHISVMDRAIGQFMKEREKFGTA